MSADTLRRAAAAMRERAEAAKCEPESAPDHRLGWYATDDHLERVLVSGGHASGAQAERDADHIASWHPAVALAVADWLDDVAAMWEPGSEFMPLEAPALVVARAYLGEHP